MRGRFSLKKMKKSIFHSFLETKKLSKLFFRATKMNLNLMHRCERDDKIDNCVHGLYRIIYTYLIKYFVSCSEYYFLAFREHTHSDGNFSRSGPPRELGRDTHFLIGIPYICSSNGRIYKMRN